MEMTSLICKRCGAEIEINENAKIAACKYCGGRYKISFDTDSNAERGANKTKAPDDGEPLDEKKELRENLRNIEEGKRQWKIYASSIYAGKGKDSLEMRRLFEEAQKKLLMGYGLDHEVIIRNYFNTEKADAAENPVSLVSCYVVMVIIALFLFLIGFMALASKNSKLCFILLSSGFILIALMALMMIGVRSDKETIAKKNEAKKRLADIEREMLQKLKSLEK